MIVSPLSQQTARFIPLPWTLVVLLCHFHWLPYRPLVSQVCSFARAFRGAAMRRARISTLEACIKTQWSPFTTSFWGLLFGFFQSPKRLWKKITVGLDQTVCVCVCVSLARDSSESVEVIIIKLDTVTASDIGMYHVLIVLTLTFIQYHRSKS